MRTIKGLYDPYLCTVRTGHPNRNWFRVTTGVKHGSVFKAYMDKIIKEFKEGKEELWHILMTSYSGAFPEWRWKRML